MAQVDPRSGDRFALKGNNANGVMDLLQATGHQRTGGSWKSMDRNRGPSKYPGLSLRHRPASCSRVRLPGCSPYIHVVCSTIGSTFLTCYQYRVGTFRATRGSSVSLQDQGVDVDSW